MENSEANTTGAGVPAIHLSEIEGVPVARDIDVAERLGFDRPRDIRKLIERNSAELESFGSLARHRGASISGKGRVMNFDEFWLNEEQALLVSVLSNAPNAPAVRAMLINTFVAWRRGHLQGVGVNVTDIATEVRKVIGGIMKSVVHSEISLALGGISPSAADIQIAVQAELARQNYTLRRGKTAGQIWRDNKLPPLKNIASWFGNKLAKSSCRIVDNGCAEMGLTKARLFDPDKAQSWIDELGGRSVIDLKIAERQGQRSLRLVQPISEQRAPS